MTQSHSNKDLWRRGETWYFRARIPSELVADYGKEIVAISLHTGDRALAQQRAREKRAELELELAKLRKKPRKLADDFRGAVLHLTDDDIERLCQRYRAERMAADELDRIGGIDDHDLQLQLDILGDGVRVLRDAYARGDLSSVRNSLSAFLRSEDLYVPPGTPSHERLLRRFQQAEIEVYDAVLRRRRGETVEVPIQPLDTLTLSDVFESWKKRKANRPPKTVRAFEQAFEALKELTTATTAAMLTKRDAVSFRDRMLARADTSARTVEKLIGFLRAAFEVARKDGKLEVNPFDGVEVEIDDLERKRRTRLPFTVSELQNIFNGPVYQPDFVPRKSLGKAQYWLPLLSLLSGARLEELAQLHVEDIRHDPQHGHYLYIHNAEERKVKTASSWRQVPLHPELVKLGFLEYVKQVKAGRLFPTLKPDKYGKLATTFSTWFGRYLDQLGITDESKVFHSFRHSFIAVCKQKAAAGIPPEVREAIVGHTPTNEIAATYGDVLYPLEPQVQAMQHVGYPGLDLSHLYQHR